MTRRQLLLTSTAVLPPERPEPDGWYGAVDDAGILTLPEDFAGQTVEVSYQVHASRDRRRRGLASDARVKVLCPA